jgi:hypothetical protein
LKLELKKYFPELSDCFIFLHKPKKMKYTMKRSIIMLFAAMLGLFTQVQASDYKAGEKVNITEQQDDNTYVAGGEVFINAIIKGDLIVAGGEVEVNDSINEDATIAGGEIIVSGVIGDDLRVFGGEIRISKDVYGDLIVTGGEVVIEASVTVWGDLILAGGEVTSYATVKGDVKAAGGEMDLGGQIDGQLDIVGGELNLYATVNGISSISAQNLNLYPEARFNSDVRYWSNEGKVDFENYLAEGASATFDEDLKKEFNFEFDMKKAMWTFTLFRIFSGLVLISLLVALVGRFFRRNAGSVKDHMGKYLGAGLLLFLGLPILSMVAFGTVIGIPLGVVGISFFVILLVMANALTAVVAAYEIREYRRENWGPGVMIAISAALFIALRLLDMVPVAGSLVNFALSAVAVGYVLKMLRKKGREETEAPIDEIV